MQLKLGKMTTKELSQWFGISYSTIRKKKKAYLEELADFCQFEEIYGGVIVKEIYLPEYTKKNTQKEIVKEEFPKAWDPSGYDTKKNVAGKIKESRKQELTISDSTLYRYTCKAGVELLGPANNYHKRGSAGNCWYCLCVIESNGQKRPLTKEERERYSQTMNKYCPEKERQKNNEILAALCIKYQNGTITKDELKEAQFELNEWRFDAQIDFMSTLEEGCSLGVWTKAQWDEPSAF